MMASKTGYCSRRWSIDTICAIEMDLIEPEDGIRLCLRVDEVPEQMTRGELREKLVLGYGVRATSASGDYVFVSWASHINDTSMFLAPYAYIDLQHITHARPHGDKGCPWTKIVDDSRGRDEP